MESMALGVRAHRSMVIDPSRQFLQAEQLVQDLCTIAGAHFVLLSMDYLQQLGEGRSPIPCLQRPTLHTRMLLSLTAHLLELARQTLLAEGKALPEERTALSHRPLHLCDL